MNIFSHSVGLPFCFVDYVLCLSEISYFQEVPFINSESQGWCYCCYVYEAIYYTNSLKVPPIFSSKNFSVDGFMLRSVIHFAFLVVVDFFCGSYFWFFNTVFLCIALGPLLGLAL